MSDLFKMAKKFGQKLDKQIAAHKDNCHACGHKLAANDKACGVCGTRRAGKVLDSEDTCQHSSVTASAPRCTNCGKKL